MLPNFFIVGAGKAGTTSLHHYLGQHPQIYMSPVKEPCYFASEIRPAFLKEDMRRHLAIQSRELPKHLQDGLPVKPLGWIAADWEDYLRLFQAANGARAIGESSAAYLWSETAPRNIRARIPDARIIMMLRDPAERAFSQYLHQLAVGLTSASFHEHLDQCRKQSGPPLGIHYPFLEIGLYAAQVKRYLDTFPRQNVRIFWYEEAWRDPAKLMTELFGFLGVDTAFIPDLSRRSLERRAPRFARAHYFLKRSGIWEWTRPLLPPSFRQRMRKTAFQSGSTLRMDARDRAMLIEYYRADIQELAALLDRDLRGWLRPAPDS